MNLLCNLPIYYYKKVYRGEFALNIDAVVVIKREDEMISYQCNQGVCRECKTKERKLKNI